MRPLIITASVALLVAGCAGSDESEVTEPPFEVATTDDVAVTDPPATDPPATDPPATDRPGTDPPGTDPPGTDPPGTDAQAPEPTSTEPLEQTTDVLLEDPFAIVEQLAGDQLNGRNNLTDGSTAARELLVSKLVGVLEPGRPEVAGGDGFLQPYDVGTNIVGILPGRGALADEYVLIGAHYDHLGPGECRMNGETDDDICNGAADNAAGVGAVLSIVNMINYADLQQPVQEVSDQDETGRRSIIVGLWDGEEDGLVGSQVYVDDPLVPLEKTVAYVNFDIQGAQLTPALANTTILVGPETGGDVLVEAARRATGASALDYATFSLVFGQGRSDHANLADAGVASVFFTDANNGCYHTVLDDIDHVDRDKFYSQIGTAEALVDDLVTMATPPSYVRDTPLTTYDDAVELLELVARAEPDFGLLPADGPATSARFLVDLQTIVDAGPEAYDDAAGGVVLAGAAALVGALAASDCALPA